jgi:hypothetical protein
MESKKQKPKRKLIENAVSGKIAGFIVLSLLILIVYSVGMGVKYHFDDSQLICYH